MAMDAGSRLGPYEVTAKLGEGGMGQVFRARDTKLNRDVAIKVLPEAFAANPDRLARFTREAQVLASLNHPNIAAIYGIEQSGVQGPGAGVQGLIMELVEGEDLSVLIDRGSPEAERDSARLREGDSAAERMGVGPHSRPRRSGLPLAEALALAKQIADALEAAHESGIVHRDLKPANIKVRADGTVKVLDFGLAKAMDRTLDSGPGTQDAANSPTLTARGTQVGMILGTAAYMAPEQARGKAVDKRADIWAFGVVLYEMLAGRRAFEGTEVSDVLAAVLRADIDFAALPATTPTRVRDLIARCLDRDLKTRLRDIGEARIVLSGPLAPAEPAAAAPRPRWKTAALTMVVAAVAATATWLAKPAPVPAAIVTRFEVETTTGEPAGLAISPDGMSVAWTAQREGGGRRIFVRRLDEFGVRALDTGQVNAQLAFSSDSRQLAYVSPSERDRAVNELRKIALGGGRSELVARVDGATSIVWSDETIYLSGFGRIQAVSESGGALRTILTGGESDLFTRLAVINDGRDLLYSHGVIPKLSSFSLRTVPVTGGPGRLVMDDVFRYAVLPTGHLIYTTRGDTLLLGRRFLQDRVEVVGDAVPLGDLVGSNTALAVSRTGTLVSIGMERTRLEVVWVHRDRGRVDVIPDVTAASEDVSLSTSGRHVLYTDVSTVQVFGDAWVWDSQDGSRMRLTSGGGVSRVAWTPRGDSALLQIERASGRELMRAEPPWSAPPVPIASSGDSASIIHAISPDGRQALRTSGTGSLVLVNTDGSGEPVPLDPQPGRQANGGFSPDGRWVVYALLDAAQRELWIRPHPSVTGGRVRLGPTGSEPVFWLASGREVFFFSGERWVSRTIRAGAPGTAPELGPIVPLDVPPGIRLRGVTPDGQRWLGVRPAAAGRPTISVVLNFFEELRTKVSVK